MSTTPHHYRTLSNVENTTTERPKLYQRRLSSFDRNEHKRKMYNDSNTFITTTTATAATNTDTTEVKKDDDDIKVSAVNTTPHFGFYSPTKNVDSNEPSSVHEVSGKEITDTFFKNLDHTPKK